jgi:hypothetical protein
MEIGAEEDKAIGEVDVVGVGTPTYSLGNHRLSIYTRLGVCCPEERRPGRSP